MTVDMEQMRKDYERLKKAEAEKKKRQQEYDGNDRPRVEKKRYWKPEQGVNKVRIIPVPGNDDKPFKEFRQAWYNRMPMVPPSVNGDPEAEDPHKDLLVQLRAVEGEEGKKAYNDVRDKPVAVCFIIDRNDSEQTPQQWTLKERELAQIMAIMFDAEAGNIFDVNTGRDLIVNYDKGNKKGAISIMPAMKSSELGSPEQVAEWTALDLWQAYRVGEVSDVDYMKHVIAGTVKEFFEEKKRQRENKDSTPAPEADPVKPPEQTAQSSADAAADALSDLAPKFLVKDPSDGSTLPEPLTLAEIQDQFGPDVEVMDEDTMSGWKKLSEVTA